MVLVPTEYKSPLLYNSTNSLFSQKPPHLPLQLVDLGVKEPLVAIGVEVPPAVAFLPALRPWPNAAEQVVDKLVSLLYGHFISFS